MVTNIANCSAAQNFLLGPSKTESHVLGPTIDPPSGVGKKIKPTSILRSKRPALSILKGSSKCADNFKTGLRKTAGKGVEELQMSLESL